MPPQLALTIPTGTPVAVQRFGEEIAQSGEFHHSGLRALAPCRSGRVGLRAVEGSGLRHFVLAYLRIAVCGDLVGEHVGDAPHGQFHIGLAGAQEHVAAEHIAQSEVVDGDCVRASGLKRGQFERPAACAVGGDGHGLGLFRIAFGCDAFAGVGSAPEAHRLAALHHHAVGQHLRKRHLGVGTGCAEQKGCGREQICYVFHYR